MRTLEGKHVLVTGGAGFIGSHLIDRIILERPSGITVVSDFSLGSENNLASARTAFPALKVIKGDVADWNSLSSIQHPEVIFNLSVIPLMASLTRPEETTERNIQMAINIARLQRYDRSTLIHISSSEVYGTAQEVPMSESHPLRPETPYAASKAAADHIVLSYQRTFNLDTVIVRPFNQYGPRQNNGKYAAIVPAVTTAMLLGKDVHVSGTGTQTRDFTHVCDTVEGIVMLHNKAEPGTVANIASEAETSMNVLVAKLAVLTEYTGSVRRSTTDRPADVRRHLGDASLLRRMGWSPQISLDNGLKETVGWYRAKLDHGL